MSRLGKKLKNIKLKKYCAALMALVTVVSAIGVGRMIQARADSYDSRDEIPTVVEFNDKYYTKDNPYVVLEVVPEICMGQFGYWVGGDSMPVKESDVRKLYAACGENADVKRQMGEAFSFSAAQLYGGQNYVNGHFICDEYGNLRDFEDRNVLAHMIFSDNDDTDMMTKFSDMTDKLVVKTVKASDLTYDDVKNANFVYLNPKTHDSSNLRAYQKMAEFCKQYNLGRATGLSQDYIWTSTSGTSTTLNISNDLALYLYMRNVNDNLAVVTDWSGIPVDRTNGFYQFLMLELAISQEQFMEEYGAEDLINDENENRAGVFQYEGSGGTIETTKTSMTVKRHDGTVVEWGTEMFWRALHPTDGSAPQAPYFNATTTPEYVHNNFFTYHGTNVMDQSLKNKESIANPDWPTCDINKIDDLFGKHGYREVLRYIMGKYSLNDLMSTIEVIEIQPWGRNEFNNEAGADKILRTFGINGDYTVKSKSFDEGTGKGTYVINKKSKDFTINIRSMSVNAFNGLSDDIVSSVDLIIIGTYNPSDYVNTNYGRNAENNGTVITEDGAIVSTSKFGNKQTSGNDFTDKAYEKLYEYVKAGLPLLEMSDVYNAGSTIDRTKRDGSDSNIYKMSRVKLNERLNAEGKASSNITSEASDSTASDFKVKKMLTYPSRPRFTIVSPAAYDYDTNRAPQDVNSIRFTIRADSKIPAGSHIKLYIDSNADALYNEVSVRGKREVFADYDIPDTINSGSEYTITLNGAIPEKWFGYFKFKIEVTRAGFTEAQESSFALKAQETRTVKVLQIYNATAAETYEGTTTMNLKGSAFSDSFRAASSVTGMRLDVTPMKVYEFEDLMADDKNKDYLSQYSIVVVGFRDSYGKAGTPFRTQPVIDALNAYIDAGNSVLFTHDTMAYQASNSDYNEPIMTTNLTQPIGMKGPGIFTNSLISKVSGQYTAFNDVSKSGSTKDTTRVNKLNWGQVTEYPYKIDDSIQVETTHGQFYQLNLEHIPTYDLDGNEVAGAYNNDVTVWYTLGADGGSNARYFNNCGQDAVNNYYIYSKGNVTYTSAGHSKIESDGPEMQLFVNTLVRSIIVATTPPEVKILNGIAVEDNKYDIIGRSVKTAEDGTVSPDNTIPLKFKVTDEDIAAGDVFAKSKIYIDANDNGTYDAGETILKDYGGTLQNEMEYDEDLLVLATAAGVQTEVLNLYTSNRLKIGIEVMDSSKAVGQAFGLYIRRNYFELD